MAALRSAGGRSGIGRPESFEGGAGFGGGGWASSIQGATGNGALALGSFGQPVHRHNQFIAGSVLDASPIRPAASFGVMCRDLGVPIF
jgi:hypothetical protein